MKKILITLALLPHIAWAGLLVSPKSAGRAGTAIAQPQDCFSGAYNPAGNAFMGDRYDLGVFATRYTGENRIRNNIEGSNGKYNSHVTRDFYIPEMGINKDVCECYMTLGIIAYNRGFNKTTYKEAVPAFGTSKLGLEYEMESLSPIFTIRFGGCHALGVSVDFLFQRLKVNGLENFATAAFSKHPNRVTNKGYDYSYGISGTVGWTSIFDDWVFIGLAYQPERKMTRFAKYKGLLPNEGELNAPQRCLGGIAIRPVPCITFEFDVEYIKWTDSRGYQNPLLPNINFNPGLGIEKGAGLGWRDQIHFRWGVEYRLNECLIVRSGYSHARTPVKSQGTFQGMLVPNIIEQYMTLGLTWFLSECNEFSLYYAYGYNHKKNGKSSIPNGVGGGNADLNEKRNEIAGIAFGRKF